jgi:beta-glucosidase-like glycosyl hydrolase/CubicO group peptidase (beta-lactamase class C family)
MNKPLSLLTFAALFLLYFVFGASAPAHQTVEPNLFKNTDKQAMAHWVDSVFNQMSLDQKVGQVIVATIDAKNTEANRQKLTGFINNQYIGGIIFSKGTPTEQAELTNIGQQTAKVPLMISIDGEWGLSMRLENTTRFPRNMALSATRDDSLVYYYGLEVARQCKVMGIHVNFAPDMDVNSNPDNPVIGTRSFGENPDRVAKLGILYSKGLEAGGVLSVAKHFPGHGDTSTDSHFVLPVLKHNRSRFDKVELRPFNEYIREGLAGMMTAHLNVPELDDSGIPGSLSKPIVTGLLQIELGFGGLIFTDGLAMKGVSTQPDMSVKALLAGNDVLLGPIDPAKEFDAIKEAAQNDSVFMKILESRCRKLLAYKYVLGVHTQKPVETAFLDEQLNTPHAAWLSRRMNMEAITLLKNEEQELPLKQLDKKSIAAIAIGGSDENPFHKTLKLYGNITCFNLGGADELAKLRKELIGFNTIIVSVHGNKSYNTQAIKKMLENRENIFVLFSTPYKLSHYNAVVETANAVVMAYENTDLAQEFAAQALFGGIGMTGKLPVSIKSSYKNGYGIETKKTRLSYGLPEDVGILSCKLDSIETIVEEGIAAEAYPGCQVLVAKDGVVIYNRSFGTFEYEKSRPVTNSDIYDIASMTKATATLPAIMKLYDQKLLTLKQPLSRFVPALKSTDKANITIREALLHETGLPSFLPYYIPAINTHSYQGRLYGNKQSDIYTAQLDDNTWGRTDYKFFPHLISTTPKTDYTLQIADKLYAHKSYNDTIIYAIARAKLRPKKNYLYSCLNFILLKEAVEYVAATDLNTFLQNAFYRKLGAVTTTFNPLNRFNKNRIVPTEKDDFLRKQLLQGYVHDEGAAFMGGIGGNAGLFSNANDLAKLFQMWLNKGEYGDERYLSEETCRLFTTAKSAKSRRGLGFDKPDMDNDRRNPCSLQAPASVYGHTGFTGTCFWIDPDNSLIYIFLSNRVYDSRTHKNLMTLNIRTRIQDKLYEAIKNE